MISVEPETPRFLVAVQRLKRQQRQRRRRQQVRAAKARVRSVLRRLREG